MFLSSLSLSNTFETISEGYNGNLYMMSSLPDPAPGVTSYTNKLYMIYQRDRVLPPITQATSQLYFMLLSTAGVGSPYILYSATVDPGQYTTDQLAEKLQDALRTHISTAAVTFGTAFEFVYNDDSSSTEWWIPHPDDIATAVSRYNPYIWPGTPAAAGPTVNGLLNMPRLGADPPFGHRATSGVPAYTMPTVCEAVTITQVSQPTVANVSAALQDTLRAVFGPQASVSASGRQLTFDTGRDYMRLKLPTGDQLASSSWRQANWTGRSYDPNAPRSYNKQLPLSPNELSRTQTTGTTPPYVGYHVFQLAGKHYTNGTALATALQVYIRSIVTDATVTFDTDVGKLLFSSTAWTLRFPSDRELRDVNFRTNWHGVEYDITDPQSFNSQLYFPAPSTFQNNAVSGQIDLIPFREIYLSSNITNYKTLQSGSGAMDILARVPIDAPFGEIINFRAYGIPDALSVSDMHFRTISFTMRDYRGKVMPIDQQVVIELCFASSDPMEML